ncbi:uncharacterized protein RAG0_13228 [Rhynchosporium agropyri]|uniref:Uncharacterized protein n=1 Tax=Rhynchosporium agropyri TaxID=914238 RepID=A0A1E1LBQ0_9HELO|nr:uncharacterized protein RAG0_13228 [Rhynchosporium agropyri]
MEAIIEGVVDWLRNTDHSGSSKVGILASPQFMELTRVSISSRDRGSAGKDFSTMIYAVSRAYTRENRPVLTFDDYARFGAIAGYAFLAHLDQVLKPDALSQYSRGGLRTAFLWVFWDDPHSRLRRLCNTPKPESDI